MHCILIILHILMEIAVTNGVVNYCGARICGNSNEHTFCKYRPGPSASCSGYIGAQLSEEEKARVLARLNRRRSEVALGWRHWPPAGDMLKLRWVEELSREAQRWADQCRPPRSPEERDICRDLYSISVGQCVASIVGEAPGLLPESMVDLWFMQSMLYDGNITSYMPARVENYYGDFAQLIWSRSHLVGCGRSRFMVEWRGRMRSVERLVCNFAPRGPMLNRPLWTPAHAASICPSRSYPDTLPGLCIYHYHVDESRNLSDSLSLQDTCLLETVYEIEKNGSLNYVGSLDELYLTKMAIATFGTPAPAIPLLYSLQKRDVLKNSGKNYDFWKVGNESKFLYSSILTDQLISSEPLEPSTTPYKSKVNTVGRPKPYDINEMNEAAWEKEIKNISDFQDLTKRKEIDCYVDYGLVAGEENDIDSTTTAARVLARLNYNDDTNYTEARSEINGFTEITNTTSGVAGSDNNLTNAGEEINDSLIGNNSVDDYLSVPESERALRDALDQMERTLASPEPVSTPGKVRRELRNLEADLQKLANTEIRGEERNKSRYRGPMLGMVLKYMPYLKPYENSIVGNAHSYCTAVRYDVSVFVCGSLLHIWYCSHFKLRTRG